VTVGTQSVSLSLSSVLSLRM